MAEKGGQPGNTNATKGRPWAAAIERALRKRSRSDQLEALDDLAEKFLDSVGVGNVQDFKELGDRLDGKPKQQVDANVSGSLGIYQPVSIPVHDREPDPLDSAAGSAAQRDTQGVG